MEERKLDLREVLEYIDPVDCSYEEWLNVGLALHHEGYPMFVWAEWSSNDGERFHPGECEAKWNSFGAYTGKQITGATITQMAKENGWTSNRSTQWDATAIPFELWLWLILIHTKLLIRPGWKHLTLKSLSTTPRTTR